MLLSVSGFFILGGQNLALPGATSPTWCCFWWPIKCRVCCSGTGWAADAIYALCLKRSSHQFCQGTEEVQEVHENGTCIMSLVKNPFFYPDLLPAGHSLTLKAEHCRPSIWPSKFKYLHQSHVICSPLDNLGHPRHADQVGKFQTPGTLFPKVQGKIFRAFFSSTCNRNLNFNLYNSMKLLRHAIIMKSRSSYSSFKLSLIYGYSEVSDITGRHLSWVSFKCKIKTKQEIFRLQKHRTRWTESGVREPIITSRPKRRRNSK